jgi:hypothetical protein
MKKLKTYELKEIHGGAITGTLINSLTKGVNTFLDLGRAVGNAIRRIGSKDICPI